MNIKVILTVLCFAFLFLQNGCKKDDDTQLNTTQTTPKEYGHLKVDVKYEDNSITYPAKNVYVRVAIYKEGATFIDNGYLYEKETDENGLVDFGTVYVGKYNIGCETKINNITYCGLHAANVIKNDNQMLSLVLKQKK